jgi:hypothetical protein
MQWFTLDKNPDTKSVVAVGTRLYQLHKSGKIWRYTGTPLTGWQELDNNPATKAIVAAGDHLYQLHNTGRIFRFTGTPLTGWQELDNNPATNAIVAVGDRLYQLHNTGKIWQYTGTPLTGWQELDNNPATKSIVAGYEPAHAGHIGGGGFPDPPRPEKYHLYQLHNSGRIWQYTGTPLTGWQELDNNPATTAIAAFDSSLCQLHQSGLVWIFTGTPHTGWNQLGPNESAHVLEVGVGQNLAAPSNVPSGIYVLTPDNTILEWGEIIH